MRITHETLLKIAQDAVAQRVKSNRGIVSAYAAGSILTGDPLLGGATDIDLFFIHDSEPPQDREIVRMSSDIQLDIVHHNQKHYHQPRHLRSDSWLGNTLYCNPILLYDTQHWFEFTQSSVRAQFWQPGNVISRVRPLSERARQLWMEMNNADLTEDGFVSGYLEIIETAANAIACLTGSPLTDRRFLAQFVERTAAIDRADLAANLLELIGAPRIDADTLRGWLPAWSFDFKAAGLLPFAPAALDVVRISYYQRGIEALLASGPAHFALWPLLATWNRAVSYHTDRPVDLSAWRSAVAALGLAQEDFSERLHTLDGYLDQVEEAVDRWSVENGA